MTPAKTSEDVLNILQANWDNWGAERSSVGSPEKAENKEAKQGSQELESISRMHIQDQFKSKAV